MQLFEFAVIYVPQDEDGNTVKADAKIIVPVTVMLAADARAVTLKAAKDIPDDLDLDFVQVVVRPF